jgi:hypothetical protein
VYTAVYRRLGRLTQSRYTLGTLAGYAREEQRQVGDGTGDELMPSREKSAQIAGWKQRQQIPTGRTPAEIPKMRLAGRIMRRFPLSIRQHKKPTSAEKKASTI